MRQCFVISDLWYRVRYAARRNRWAVLFYTLISAAFIIIGVAVGIKIDDKSAYVLGNGGGIFLFLRGERGAVAFFFTDILMSALYLAFAAVVVYPWPVSFFSYAPALYKSYVLGVQTCVILSVYSGSALPMLFVLYIPVCIIELIVYCVGSFKTRRFAATLRRGSPGKCEIAEHFRAMLPGLFVLALCSLLKTMTAVLFGSALIGVL